MNLHYECSGKGSPLIILHGLFGSLDNWRTMSRKLSSHFQVFSIDLRNHGKSPRSDTFNYQLMTEDLKVFVNRHSLYPVCLLGHSMGGKVAMQFAVTWPGLIEKLVVVDISPKDYQPRHAEILQRLLSINLNHYSERMEMDKALSVTIPDYATRQFLLKNMVQTNNGGFAWRFNLKSIARHYGDIIKGIDGDICCDKPTLFLKGERSDYMQKEDLVKIYRLFPHARMAIVPNAGHWLHMDAPTEFLTAVLEFLQTS